MTKCRALTRRPHGHPSQLRKQGLGTGSHPSWGAGLDLESGGHKCQQGVTGQCHTVKKTVTEVIAKASATEKLVFVLFF